MLAFKSAFLTFFLTIPLFSIVAVANHELGERGGNPCHSPFLEETDRPYYPAQPNSRTFKFKFEFHPPQNRSYPTIIYVPGGPGDNSIGTAGSWAPDTWGQVLIDPRGVGCNQVEGIDSEPDFYSAENDASDILAVIRAIGVKNYALHGVSYGTLVATMVANRAEAGEASPPKAVVLDGVIGRAFRATEENDSFSANWEKFKSTLPPKAITALKAEDNFLGVSPSAWAIWIRINLVKGKVPTLINPIEELRDLGGNTEQVEAAKEDLRFRVSSVADSFPDPIYLNITCVQISERKFDLELRNGNLVSVPSDECGSIKFSRPFDSKNWQIKAPKFYLSGTLDPVTPPWQAKYHYQNQKAGNKYFISINNGGHGSIGGALHTCEDYIWEAIFRDPKHLDDVLAQCPMKASVRKF